MVIMRTTPPQLVIQRRHRGRHALTFNIVFREESQQFGGGEPEEYPARVRDGRHPCTLGLLLGLIQVTYQNKKDSPFDTRPATIPIFLIALCIYGFATAALLKSKASKEVEVTEEQQPSNKGHYFRCFYRILDVIVRISALVTISCLVSVFVPDGLHWIVFVSCASILSAPVVAWDLMLHGIFQSANFVEGAAVPDMV
ncbi:hypothetical protein Vadar_006952 [Vaccinium darrowii]|uniref:Uncharacterized protein n=1 Tax=Vaccinium darrowii TaxID=229202 RepID=A0ACB7Y5A2_9ERIC|nr:hypothetical protein Vadar_006952 [Vaccinium darrowii]